MLEVKNVSKQYKGEDKLLFDAVSDVSLPMEDHHIYALVGESGCGKSTLSRLILGLESPSSGQILLDGKPISRKGKRNRKETAKAIQLVLQDGKSALDPHFTVYQAIAEPIRNLLNIPKEKERARIFELLDRMGMPKETANKKTGELSGGQQKRVGIARALAVSPRYIVFDESISGLDVILRKSILELLKRVQEEEQCCYLFITHEIDAALYLADEIHVMQNGKLIRNNRDYFLQYDADSEAAERFFDGLAPRYKASFCLDSPPTRIFVQILNHPDAAAEQFAGAYIRENANAINERVWQLGVVRERLAALEQTPGGHHLRRAIRRSLEGVEAKSVRLELLKDGKPLEVRIAASELLHTGSPDYTTWNMDAPSRKAFAQLYGRDARLFPQDIVRILHSRNVLYDAVNNPVFQ